MRKIIMFNVVTLDGFFEGANGDISWHHVDAEFNQFASDQLDTMDTLLFGRVTYQGMASYWPTPAAIADDPVIADKMNTLPKVVFSRTLEKVEWANSRLVKDNIADEVAKLKQQSGKDMVIFGSGGLVSTLTQLGVIDEFRLMVNPVVLGSGRSLFSGLQAKVQLTHLRTRVFNSGNVLLSYEPVRS